MMSLVSKYLGKREKEISLLIIEEIKSEELIDSQIIKFSDILNSSFSQKVNKTKIVIEKIHYDLTFESDPSKGISKICDPKND